MHRLSLKNRESGHLAFYLLLLLNQHLLCLCGGGRLEGYKKSVKYSDQFMKAFTQITQELTKGVRRSVLSVS